MNRLTTLLILAVSLTLLSGFGSFERWFSPNANLWPRWQRHDPAMDDKIDHAVWDSLLTRYVQTNASGPNLVDYAGFTAADRRQLDGYIDTMTGLSISRFNRREQLAYWINLYNAVTVQIVLLHYPVASIRDIKISPGLLSVGPWNKKLITIEGEALSLNDIDHRILRPIWRDPRIHYALNCASVGCPNLRANAYQVGDMDLSLDMAARAYVNDPRGVSIANGKVSVSKIYDWFIADFGGSPKLVLQHLEFFANPALAAQLKDIGKLSGTQYDWTLNAVAR